MKNKLIIVFIFISSLFSEAGAQVLSLDSCIKIAVTKSTEVLKGSNSVALAGTMVLQSYGQYLPNLVLGANYNYNAGNEETSPTPITIVNSNRSIFSYQLTSNVNIFSGLNNKASLKAAILAREGAQYDLARAKQQVTFDVIQSYLTVILDKKIVDYAMQNLNTSQKREEQLKSLTEIGRTIKSDYYQQQAETSNDKLFLISSENKLRNDKLILLQKLRMDAAPESFDFADITIDDSPLTDENSNEEKLIKEAVSQRVDLNSLENRIDVAKQNIIRYRSNRIPQLSFNAGLYSSGAYLNSLYINGESEIPPTQRDVGYQLFNQVYYIFGLNASWNIFDKSQARANIDAQKIAMNNATIDYEDLKIQISIDIRQALGDYKSALQQLETSGKGLDAAQLAFETITGRYHEGKANFIELSDAQNTFLQAQENSIQAKINVMLQKKIIDYYLGK